MSASHDFGLPTTTDRVPLTASQKARLVSECLPFFFFSAVVVIYLTVLRGVVGEPSVLFLLFIGFVLFVVGQVALLRFRDLVSGVALVQDDVLVKHSGSRGGRKRLLYGEFEKLGKLRMMAKPFYHSQPGTRYRVCYSPVSKIVWSLEPPG